MGLLARAVNHRNIDEWISRHPHAAGWCWQRAREHVGGRDLEEGIATATRLSREGFAVSISVFTFPAACRKEATQATETYVHLAAMLDRLPPSVWIALDLSSIGLDLGQEIAHSHLAMIASVLGKDRIVQIGAEDCLRTDAVLSVVRHAAADQLPVAATIQCKLRRSMEDAIRLAELGIYTRLVKGAYPCSPTARFSTVDDVRLAYIRLARIIASSGTSLSLATHDRILREALLHLSANVSHDMCFGIRTEDANSLLARGVPVRIEFAVGPGWLRYYLRRRTEAHRSMRCRRWEPAA